MLVDERRDLIRTTIEDVLRALPELETGYHAAAGQFQRGATSEGCALLAELLEVEARIGAFVHEVARELGEPFYAIRIEDQSPIAIRERWLSLLAGLRDDLRSRDWVRAGDILHHEAPREARRLGAVLQQALPLV